MNLDRDARLNYFSNHYLFKSLSENELSALIDKTGIITAKSEKQIIHLDDPAQNIYFVFSGNLQMTRIDGKGRSSSSILSTGDVFGHESLDGKAIRYKTLVQAQDQSVLFLLSNKCVVELCEEYPRFKQIFALILQSSHLLEKKGFPWKGQRENVVYVARRHPSTLFTSLIPPAIILVLSFLGTLILYGFVLKGETSLFSWFGLVAGLCLLWVIWIVFDWYNDYYVVTNQRLLVLEKVLFFYESRQETPLEAIQSLITASELFGRWMTFGSIQIRTYTGEITFPGIELPELVIDLIEYYSQKVKSKENREDRRKIESTIRDRLHLSTTTSGPREDNQIDEVEAAPAQERKGTFASLFSLKEVTGDSITYRTHWFILAAKLLAPTIFCLLVLSALIARLQNMLTTIPLELAALFAALFILIGWGWWIYEFLDWHNDIYIVNSEQVIDINRKPLGHEEKNSAPLKNIQTIEYKRIGIFGLMFNYGTVFIRVGDSELTFDYVSNPSEVQKEIFQHFMQFTLNEKKINIEGENERMADWIQAYHRVTNTPGRGHDANQEKGNQVK